MGAVAFWIALAAVLISGQWVKARSEAMKHATIRRILETTGQVDEEKLKELFEPPVQPWVRDRLQMIREVLAKTERVDQAAVKELLVKELFRPPPDPWAGSPGDTYKFLRGFGALVLFIAVGLVICFSILYLGNAVQQVHALIGCAVASLVAMGGAGFFYASRFCDPPPPKGDRA